MGDCVHDPSFKGRKTQDIELGVKGNFIGSVAVDPPRMRSVGLGITSMNQGHGNLCVSIPGTHPHAFFNEIRRIPIGDFSNFENASLPVLKIEFFHGG